MATADLSAIAVEYINDQIPDLLIKENGLWNSLMKRKKYVDGGNYFKMPLNYAPTASAQFYNGVNTVFPVNTNQTLTSAQLQWKYFMSSFAITQQDVTVTESSKEAIIGLYQLKMAGAVNTAVQLLSERVWQSAILDTNQFNGIADIFADSGVAYAGVSNTDYPDWFYNLDNTTNVITYTAIQKMMNTIKRNINQSPIDPVFMNTYKVDLLLSNEALISEYMGNQQQFQRFVNTQKLASGFIGLDVSGVEWIGDYFAPGSATTTEDNHLYVLSTASLGLFYKYGFGSDKKSPMNIKDQIVPFQPIEYSITHSCGNMFCNNRRVNGVFKNLAVSA